MLARVKRTAGLCTALLASSLIPAAAQTGGKDYDDAAAEQARRYLKEGRDIFRFDTFDDAMPRGSVTAATAGPTATSTSA